MSLQHKRFRTDTVYLAEKPLAEFVLIWMSAALYRSSRVFLHLGIKRHVH